jgi:hypothetical protein
VLAPHRRGRARPGRPTPRALTRWEHLCFHQESTMTSTTPAITTKLSDTQLVILSAASQRPDRAVVMPERLTGGAADKVVSALARKGLVEPVTAGPGMPVWRESGDGRHLALRITAAGLKALGIEPDMSPAADQAPAEQPAPARKWKAGKRPGPDARVSTAEPKEPPSARTRQPRTGTKQEMLIGMLKRPKGATVPEVVEATGWLPHSVRGAMAGALKKKLGLQISSEKVEGRGRVYRIEGRVYRIEE